MAKVRDRHVGTVQGALGDQVFKVLNGDSYVAQLPHKSNTEPSVKVKNQRKRFGLTAKFAKAIYALLLLRLFWKSYTPAETTKKLSVYTKIGKANFNAVTSTDISDLAVLVPDFGFPVVPTATTLTKSTVTVVVDPLGDSGIINLTNEKYVYALCVIHFSQPTATIYDDNRFLSLKSARLNLTLTGDLSFTMTLDGAMGQVFDAYTAKKAWFVLVTTDTDEAPVHFSSTFVEL